MRKEFLKCPFGVPVLDDERGDTFNDSADPGARIRSKTLKKK